MTLACVMRKLMLVAAEALNEVTGAHMGEVVMKSIMRMSSLQEAHYAVTAKTYFTNSSSKNPI